MRGILAAWMMLAIVDTAISDTPHATPAAERPKISRQAAVYFADNLVDSLQFIAANFARPTDLSALHQAAIRGLYEQAGVSVSPMAVVEARKAVAGGREGMVRFWREIRMDLGDLAILRENRGLVAALRGAVRTLDPYSDILAGTDARRNQFAENTMSLGLEVSHLGSGGAILVTSVALGSPAHRSGLRAGDRITQINGHAAGDVDKDARDLAGSRSIWLRVLRPSTQLQRLLSLTPASFQHELLLGTQRRADEKWDYGIPGATDLKYIRCSGLEHGTSGDLVRLVAELRSVGMRGLILDLRWFPLGWLEEALAVANLFQSHFVPGFFMMPTPANQLAQLDPFLNMNRRRPVVRYRNEQNEDNYLPDHPYIGLSNFPLVILVNADTSGAGELIAGVLQDNSRAMIAGQRTRGKGSVQRVFSLESEMNLRDPIPNVSLRLTTGLIIRPSGKNLHRFPDSRPDDDWGVRPDPRMECRVSADFSARLKSWWELQSQRFSGDSEILPLDDPDADPQYSAALRWLISATRK